MRAARAPKGDDEHGGKIGRSLRAMSISALGRTGRACFRGMVGGALCSYHMYMYFIQTNARHAIR